MIQMDAPKLMMNRSRLVAWLLLAVPLLIYVVFWPVRARLDLGVIERHTAGSIWNRMAESLPGMNPQWLIEAAFWIGAVSFMAGALYLVWLALDGAGKGARSSNGPAMPPDSPVLNLE